MLANGLIHYNVLPLNIDDQGGVHWQIYTHYNHIGEATDEIQ